MLSGGTVAAVYLGLGLLLSGPFGVLIQIAIPVSYVISVLFNYSTRWFVFAHSDEFALSRTGAVPALCPDRCCAVRADRAGDGGVARRAGARERVATR